MTTARQRIISVAFGLGVLTLGASCAQRELVLPGERFPVRASLDESQPTEANPLPLAATESAPGEARPISLPAVQSNANWPQRGGGPRHVAPHAALSSAPVAVWTVTVGQGSGKRNRIAAAPVVLDGRVFTMDAGTVVSAVSTGGALVWQSDLTAAFDRGGELSGGGLAADGNRLYAATAYGEVVAMDAATGVVVWRQRVDAPLSGAPAVADGQVYVSGRDGSAWALSADDGKVAWQVFGSPGKTGVLGTSAPTVGDRAVIFPSNAGDLMAVLKVGGGVKVWQAQLQGRRLGRAYAWTADVTGDAALVGKTIYAGTAAGRTLALDAGSGDAIWDADEGALGPLAIAGDSVFLVSDEAHLVRLDAATGETVWSVEMPYFLADKVKKREGIHAHYGPVLAGGRLWVASSDGLLRGFSPTDGSLVHTAELPGGAATQPAVAGGTLYVVTTKGQLLAFR